MLILLKEREEFIRSNNELDDNCEPNKEITSIPFKCLGVWRNRNESSTYKLCDI